MSTTPETRAQPAPLVSESLHAALATGERPPRPSALSACLTFGWRGMLKIKHVPEQLIDVSLTPVLFLLMFTYLFGGAVAGSTDEYLQFLLPGVLVQSVLFTAVYSGVSLNTDVTKGVVDRFRSLPLWRPAPLVGAVVGDSVRYVIASAVVMVLGLIMGFEAAGGLGGILAAVALIVVFTFSLSWVFTVVGLVMRAPNAVMNTGFMALFPLVFLSNIFVEPETLPGWLEWFVGVNPISHLVSASRGFMQGNVDGSDVVVVLGTAAALTAVFAPLTVRLYRNRSYTRPASWDQSLASDPGSAGTSTACSLERFERDDVERPLVRRGEHDEGGRAVAVGAQPVDGGDAPAVAGDEPGEAVRAASAWSGRCRCSAGARGTRRSRPRRSCGCRGPRGRCCSSRRGRSP